MIEESGEAFCDYREVAVVRILVLSSRRGFRTCKTNGDYVLRLGFVLATSL